MKSLSDHVLNATKFTLVDPASGWRRRSEFALHTSVRGSYNGQYGNGKTDYVSEVKPEQLIGNTFINACLLPQEDRAQAGHKVYEDPGEVAGILSTRAFARGEIRNDHNTYYCLHTAEGGYVLEETTITGI